MISISQAHNEALKKYSPLERGDEGGGGLSKEPTSQLTKISRLLSLSDSLSFPFESGAVISYRSDTTYGTRVFLKKRYPSLNIVRCTGLYGTILYLSAQVRVAGVNTGRFNAVLKYECPNDFRSVLRTERSRTVQSFIM